MKIEKTAWDSVDVGRLEEAADPSATADLAAVLIVDGLANVVFSRSDADDREREDRGVDASKARDGFDGIRKGGDEIF